MDTTKKKDNECGTGYSTPQGVENTKRNFDFCEIGYKTNAGLLKLGKNIFQLLLSLDTGFIDEVMRECYPRGWRTHSPRSFVLILFFNELMGKTSKEMLELLSSGNKFLRKDDGTKKGKKTNVIMGTAIGWASRIGVKSVLPSESQISTFKKKVGEGRINYCFNMLAAQVLEKVEADSISEEEAMGIVMKELKQRFAI